MPTISGAALPTLLRDARYAWRGLLRRPSFALISVITLALGIGVNTAVFSVFHAVLLRPLPYDDPDQLALIWTRFSDAGTARAPVSGTILREIEQRNLTLSGVAGIWVGTGTFTGENPEQVRIAQVTPNFFDVLGVRASHGRTFTKEEEAGGRPAMILTDGLFRRRFAADTSLLGNGVATQDAAATVVGVLPAGFELQFAPDANVPADVQAFIPFPFNIYELPRKLYYIRLVARLKPGVSMEQAQRDLDRVAGEIRGGYTEFAAADVRFTLTGMHADAVKDVKPALAALLAGAALVLLICCVNVTGMLLARASDRRKEIALRMALGAGRGRILRQLLTEGGLLCLLGGAAGVAAGWAGFRALIAIRPERLARIGDASLSWQMLAVAAAASLAATLLFGLAPAIESLRLDLIETLRAGGRGWLGRLHRRTGAALVVGEITLSFVLVTGAALTVRTLSKIEQVRPGFEPHQLLTFQLGFGRTLYPAIQFSRIAEWETELAALAGVERVGATSHLPLDDFPNWYMAYRPEGVAADRASTLIADHRSVTPGYLEALGARLIEGRYFDRQDGAGARQVLIVDELLARSAWPGQSALGRSVEAQHVTKSGFAPVPAVVVGVVEHVRNHSLTREVRPQVYIPWEQSPRSPLTFVVRTRGADPLSLVPAIREMLHRRAPNLAMAKVRPMTEYVERDIAPAGFTAVLAAIFGVLALVLAATGVYGVIDYQVSRRLPEMGIRMALGAGTGDVARLVLRQGLGLAASGALLGGVAAIVAARWLGSLVYGVSVRDPLSYGVALLLLPAAALLGCWRPAWRAAAADPAETIREQ